MVNNINEILDEPWMDSTGKWHKIKNVAECIKMKKGEILFNSYMIEQQKIEANTILIEEGQRRMEAWRTEVARIQQKYPIIVGDIYSGVPQSIGLPAKPNSGEVCRVLYEKAKSWTTLGPAYNPEMDGFLYKYYNEIPFTPSVMINISPDWKGMEYEDYMVMLLKKTIEDYFKNCSRWETVSYVIECGAEGDFIHAHCVAKVNPKMLKSVIDGRSWVNGKKKDTSHIGKGNHYQELKKIWDSKCSAGWMAKYKGLLKGKNSVQRIILRADELVSDKLDYLIEAKKPLGHKNAEHPKCPLFRELELLPRVL